MAETRTADVIVIGGGPAGLAAAIAAHENGAKVLLIEREDRLGGILKQCIHDGFGLIRFKEKLSGPEYARRFIDIFEEDGIEALTTTFVTKLEKQPDGTFHLEAVCDKGMLFLTCKALVLATGCRERTAKQIFLHGTRPAGVYTAGTAQHLINLLGQMPTKRCVILGSGDIGLIMARRLTLEGADVVGVYEAMPQPSGLVRNIHQCLYDFDIPLHLSKTVSQVFGRDRVEAVEICDTDENMQPIPGTEERIPCDALILSVGLIPENELAESLGVEIDPDTKGPLCDAQYMSSVEGVFSCGNAYHVSDLVDDVSKEGEAAGKNAAEYAKGNKAGEHTLKSLGKKLPPEFHGTLGGQEGNTRELVCIVCPNSCLLKAEPNEDGTWNITGNKCPRGIPFAESELTHPVRTLCTTVKTTGSPPVLPVRLSGEIPKERIPDAMREINKVTVTGPLKTGDVIRENFLGLSVDLIATAPLD